MQKILHLRRFTGFSIRPESTFQGRPLERQVKTSPGRHFRTSPGRQIGTSPGRSNKIFRGRPGDVGGGRPRDQYLPVGINDLIEISTYKIFWLLQGGVTSLVTLVLPWSNQRILSIYLISSSCNWLISLIYDKCWLLDCEFYYQVFLCMWLWTLEEAYTEWTDE